MCSVFPASGRLCMRKKEKTIRSGSPFSRLISPVCAEHSLILITAARKPRRSACPRSAARRNRISDRPWYTLLRFDCMSYRRGIEEKVPCHGKIFLPKTEILVLTRACRYAMILERHRVQKYPRGRRGSPAKGVGRFRPGARVQIPPSAPEEQLEFVQDLGCSFLLSLNLRLDSSQFQNGVFLFPLFFPLICFQAFSRITLWMNTSILCALAMDIVFFTCPYCFSVKAAL